MSIFASSGRLLSFHKDHSQTAGEITGYRAIDGTANYFIPYLRTVDQVKLRKELKRDAVRLREHGGDLLKDRHNLLHKLREVILGGFLAKRGHSVEYEREFKLQVDGRSWQTVSEFRTSSVSNWSWLSQEMLSPTTSATSCMRRSPGSSCGFRR
jgi:hypothetical protein